MSPFKFKTVFDPEQAACLLAGVTNPRENYAAVRLWEEEIERSFPPLRETVTVGDYWGSHKKTRITPAKITREQLKSWCEAKRIFPPDLFEEPQSLPPPADTDKLANKAAYAVYTMLAAALVQQEQYGRDGLRDREKFLKKWVADLAGQGIELPIKDQRTLLTNIEKVALKVDSLYPE